MFNKILVPVDIDYPKASKAVYDNAAELASLSGAQIRIVSVMPGFTMPIVASFVTEEIKKQAQAHFQKALDDFVAANCKGANVSYKVLVGKHYEEILKMADKWGSDLIVVYHNRNRTVNEAFSSTCAQRVVKEANCSVLRLRNLLK
ncbi:universal stress protein [Desulfotignum phosphitoxidans]|uniref:UspA-like protein n=1 Tax=Desulfotignum phosphitoxidans DSM 13687 TaxID=1286635 RepID=S0G776_9BACT|nr:universal stress protein [Desulfotignum phosphitoxidans]EMS80636.1 UspA-like protein [Desulfotignum phosphitoxidans DSM 13687]